MEFKLKAPFIIQILSITIIIQATVAPETPDEEIGGVPKTEVRNFLDQQENLQKVVEIFATAKQSVVTGSKNAKKKIASYDKTKLSEDMKKVLDYIASSPDKAFKEMEPMLKEIQERHKRLDEGSVAYRMIARPVWSMATGLGNLGMQAVGFTIKTAGGVVQLLTNGAQTGSEAYYQGKPAEESEKVNKVFKKINSGLSMVQNLGDKVMERGNRGFRGGSFRTDDESNKNRRDGEAAA